MSKYRLPWETEDDRVFIIQSKVEGLQDIQNI